MLVSLGRWQLHRAEEKRALFDAFAAGSDATQQISTCERRKSRATAGLSSSGRYDGTRQVLIDNMVNAERAGYFVITPFALKDGGWVLVNRGWVPLGRSRADRPAIPVAGNLRSIRGRADNLPSPGIHMGVPAPLAPPYPVVAAYPTRAEVAQLLKEIQWTSATDLVLLDAAEPDGYRAQLGPAGISAHAPHRLCGAMVRIGAGLGGDLRRDQLSRQGRPSVARRSMSERGV